MRESVKDILIRRDNMTPKEADELISETIEELQDLGLSGGDYEDAVDIMANNLGLEPDYMDELIF